VTLVNGVMSATPALVTVIAGHAGAGKTTVLRHLLHEIHGVRVAVLVRDPAALETGVEPLARHGQDAIVLGNGSVCCRLTAGVRRTLSELERWAGHMDHVVLESPGSEDPGRLARYVIEPQYSLDGTIIIADVEAVRAEASQRTRGGRVLRQLRAGDVVVLNKIDLVSPVERESIVDWLHEVVPEARLVEAVHGRLPTALVLGHHDPAAAGTHYAAWSWRFAEPLGREKFARWVSSLPRDVLRAFGTLYLRHDPTHRYRFRLLGARWTIQRGEPWDREPPGNRLMVLGPVGAWDSAWMDALAAERLKRG
jgi:G3E family GTPase